MSSDRVHPFGNGFEFSLRGERVSVEAWGRDAVRVRGGISTDRKRPELSALLAPAAVSATVRLGPAVRPAEAAAWEHGEPIRAAEDVAATLVNGAITATMTFGGRLRFLRTGTGEVLLEEIVAVPLARRVARSYQPEGSGRHAIAQSFAAAEGERLFGLGHHEHCRADLKGQVVDLFQRNTEVCVPFVVSNRGYGFLWNTPAIGRVEFGAEATRWIAGDSVELDYWVAAGGSLKDILRHYADATGHSPAFPAWASGFWQSSCRYRRQEDLLRVAREQKRRGLPLEVIVIDFLHSPSFGDWTFNPEEWPDPEALVAELKSLGVRAMVSVWPSINPRSANFPLMQERGLLVGTQAGPPLHFVFADVGQERAALAYYDPTNPAARRFVWEKFRASYHARGIAIPWLDACEPAVGAHDHANLRYALGPGRAVGCYYPEANLQTFSEGFAAVGEREPFILTRSVWAGSQRHAACLFPGDLPTDFETLRRQVPAHLNLGLSGIQWWTTDIGGFLGGNPDDPLMRELLVRWAQFAVFGPVFRMHGDREPLPGEDERDNEIWSYGETVYAILRDLLQLRERMRPEIQVLMDEASRTGLPMMRPLFLEFPNDSRSWEIDDQFLWGADVLVAPVLVPGASTRHVYLPAGGDWTDLAGSQQWAGGQFVTINVTLADIPLFVRAGASFP